MMSTADFTARLGLSLPIVQAPMAGVQGSALAVAVSKAGGLGSLPCATLSVEQVRSELAAIRSQTDKPFNVNFFCHTAPVPDPAREARWRAVLAPYYVECNIDAEALPDVPGRAPFDAAMTELVEAVRPAVVSFHFGVPEAALLARVKATGAQVWSSATTVEEAEYLERAGVDAVIAQGLEAGGHRGMFLTDDLSTQMSMCALVPQVVRAVRVPVVAAGGIADASGVRAALALGASAVQVGTAYLLCPEATTSAVHRQTLRSLSARHTAVTNVFTGRPARAVVNRVVREHGPLNALAPAFPRAVQALAALRARAEADGRDDFSPQWAGQNVSGCREIPAADLTRALAAGREPTGSL